MLVLICSFLGLTGLCRVSCTAVLLELVVDRLLRRRGLSRLQTSGTFFLRLLAAGQRRGDPASAPHSASRPPRVPLRYRYSREPGLTA